MIGKKPKIAIKSVILFISLAAVSGVILASMNLISQARERWIERGRVESSNLTDTVVGWLEENFAVMYGIGSFFEYSEYVSESEFFGIASRLETRGSANFINEFVVLRREDESREWTTQRLSISEGIWSRFPFAEDWIGIGITLERALEIEGRVILGPLSYHPEEPHSRFLSVAFAVPGRDSKIVIIGFLDYKTLAGSLLNLYVPPGLEFVLMARSSGPGSPLEVLTGEPTDAARERFERRFAIANSELSFLWEIHSDYDGGPETALGLVVLIGGLSLFLLIAAVFFILIRQNSSISRRVETATADLVAARNEAEEANRSKSDFLANMSHEIRTPMNAIIGMGHLIGRTELSEKQQDYVAKIQASAKSLLGIINDILDFSKIEAGKLSMESIDFNLYEVFDTLSNVIGVKAQSKKLELIFHIESDVPPLLIGDPLRLGQILLNLSNNAIKFTERGEIEVFVKVLERSDGRVKLHFGVRDTGIGLSDQQKSKLFQAFAQADTSTTRKYGGTGLGLSICKRLVELMDGEIGVESAVSRGSVFYFSVELGIANDKPVIFHNDKICSLRGLVIDGNERVRQIINDYLESFSIECRTVSSIKEAIVTDDLTSFDLILVSNALFRSLDSETATQISKISEGSIKTKVVLMTDMDNANMPERIPDLDFDHFLVKPIRMTSLYNTLLKICNNEGNVQAVFTEIEKHPDLKSVRGARLLLVEDNAINQQVAKEILESEGFYLDVADNGMEAVQYARSSDYDLVLMDLQMPLLDGYGATVEIRKFASKDSLPIIAMTADAMVGVRDKVMVSGMNDYLSKPIDTIKLCKILLKWIKPGIRNLPEEYSTADKSFKGDQFPPIDGIDTESGLKRLGFNRELYIKLLQQFTDDYRHISDKISVLMESGEIETAVREAHSAKGVSANLGAEKLSGVIAELEGALKNGKDFNPLLGQVSVEILRLVESIIDSGLIASPVEIKKRKISVEEMTSNLDHILESLKKRKPAPAAALLDEMLKCELPPACKDKIEEARKLLDKYRMKDAVVILNKLLIKK